MCVSASQLVEWDFELTCDVADLIRTYITLCALQMFVLLLPSTMVMHSLLSVCVRTTPRAVDRFGSNFQSKNMPRTNLLDFEHSAQGKGFQGGTNFEPPPLCTLLLLTYIYQMWRCPRGKLPRPMDSGETGQLFSKVCALTSARVTTTTAAAVSSVYSHNR